MIICSKQLIEVEKPGYRIYYSSGDNNKNKIEYANKG